MCYIPGGLGWGTVEHPMVPWHGDPWHGPGWSGPMSGAEVQEVFAFFSVDGYSRPRGAVFFFFFVYMDHVRKKKRAEWDKFLGLVSSDSSFFLK